MRKNIKNKNFFKTGEYYLAVTLLALNEKLVEIEKAEKSARAIFVFEDSPNLGKNIRNYRTGRVLIEPQSLFFQHKSLKSRLYED